MSRLFKVLLGLATLAGMAGAPFRWPWPPG